MQFNSSVTTDCVEEIHYTDVTRHDVIVSRHNWSLSQLQFRSANL